MNERRNPPTRRPNEQRSALFRGQLMRRPITQNTASQAEANRLENAPNVHDETSDIVVRDQQGEIELGDPPTPILEDFNEDAIDEGQEVEKERQRLAEAVNSHRISHSIVPEQQEELLEAVRASLRTKVNALAEDNWRFEPEEPSRA